MNAIVLLEDVTKAFKNKKAVDDVSFSINKGEVVAILGPNGAGKTTTIMMMLGLLKPTSGEIKLFNMDPKEKRVRERIGAMLQEVSVIDALKVIEIIQLFRSYYPNPMSVEELIVCTGLSDADLKKRAEKLSGGQKRRLGFALALAGDPELVFLDEPTVGMDITARKQFWQTISHLKEQGKTIIFTTHYLQEADDVADRILLFHRGTIVEEGAPKEIKMKLSKQSVSFVSEEELTIAELALLPNASNVYQKDGRIYIVTDNTDKILAEVFEKKYKISSIQIEQGRLDEAFEQLTNNREAI
ncbi:ABC-2 type transport system ATP-binding protein [Cytobacillus eiseniae]|uniref:ABC-2 type transport system ATP-binding protein n=1 Tax=Cytobacillus eiseniae TaxID=762947 RepID=A0ABS4RD81_9BACI|nr:ABC transporter ATP-binding protein [Cytobacillus eiseniae]MBP2240852.1 ABC-2 type transport system ATP-binding protein [Cytobacillus eiseniae]